MDLRTCYVAFPSPSDPPLQVAGRLNLPARPDGTAGPAVLICHGSDGVDGRGAFYAEALNASGIATLEIDMWAARGVVRGAAARPSAVPKTLPDAFGGLAFLRRQPEIDPSRIAIAGFSWGGVVAMLTAARGTADRWANGDGFVAHAAFYPVLWSYNSAPGHDFKDLTGAPVLIQAGARDAYDTPAAVRAFEARLDAETRRHVELVIHDGATHAFDRNGPTKVVVDPYAHDGAGGEVLFEHHPAAAAAARARLCAFFAGVFAASERPD